MLLVAGLGGALVFALPATALAKPHPHSSTTTTSPGSSSQSHAVAKLVLQPSAIGHVSVERAGTTTFAPATNGESLHVGDTIKTDSVAIAEIDYATDSFTRLDVNTTFTITKLTDSKGDRQVNGTLQTGQTWNRTVALTQSQSFDQEGAGTTAAVAGTAFVVDCTTPTTCTFTAVIDNVDLTGNAGQTQILNPLTQCVSTDGTLCTAPSQLTPDQLALIQWIQLNVYLDFTEYGLGNGVFDPFGGTVNVTNGVVQSFAPSSNGQGFTPQTPPPSPPALASPPIKAGGAYDGTFGGNPQDPTGGCTNPHQSQGDYEALSENDGIPEIYVGDDCSVDFILQAADPMGVFDFHFTVLPSALGVLTVTQGRDSGQTVDMNHPYDPSDVFTFASSDDDSTPGDDIGYTSFAFQAFDSSTQLASAIQTVDVDVQSDCDDSDPEPACFGVLSTGATTSVARTTPTTAAAGTTPPTTTAPTTTSTTTPNGPPPTP